MEMRGNLGVVLFPGECGDVEKGSLPGKLHAWISLLIGDYCE